MPTVCVVPRRCTAPRANALAFVHHTLAIEMNAATDNPMVFAADDEIISGGNFHGAPVALAADVLAIAVTHLATIKRTPQRSSAQRLGQRPAAVFSRRTAACIRA